MFACLVSLIDMFFKLYFFIKYLKIRINKQIDTKKQIKNNKNALFIYRLRKKNMVIKNRSVILIESIEMASFDLFIIIIIDKINV